MFWNVLPLANPQEQIHHQICVLGASLDRWEKARGHQLEGFSHSSV
jgi:hypothetical protein